MTTRDQVVAEARSWLGTPFAHQGRLKGVAADCAGVVEMTPKALGMYADARIEPYLMSPNPVRMRAELLRHLDAITMAELLPGDVLWFRAELFGQHLGVVTQVSPEVAMVHAFGRPRVMRCVEQTLGKFWRDRIVGCFRYRGIT